VAPRRVAAVLGLALVLSACTQDSVTPTPEEVPEPEAVETCEGLVDVGRQLVRAWVNVVEQLRVDTLLEETLPPEFAELDRLGTDLDERAQGLDCDLAAMNAEITAEVSDLAPDNPAAALVLEIVAGGLIAPPTTSTAPPTTIPGGSTTPDGTVTPETPTTTTPG
jgi:hypothetical protein